MKWPWQSPPRRKLPVDNSLAERLEEVAGRLESVATELSRRLDQYRQELPEELPEETHD